MLTSASTSGGCRWTSILPLTNHSWRHRQRCCHCCWSSKLWLVGLAAQKSWVWCGRLCPRSWIVHQSQQWTVCHGQGGRRWHSPGGGAVGELRVIRVILILIKTLKSKRSKEYKCHCLGWPCVFLHCPTVLENLIATVLKHVHKCTKNSFENQSQGYIFIVLDFFNTLSSQVLQEHVWKNWININYIQPELTAYISCGVAVLVPLDLWHLKVKLSLALPESRPKDKYLGAMSDDILYSRHVVCSLSGSGHQSICWEPYPPCFAGRIQTACAASLLSLPPHAPSDVTWSGGGVRKRSTVGP